MVLERVGLMFQRDPADVDEAVIKKEHYNQGKNARAAARDAAVSLAQAKALAVSPRHPDAWIIGADQMLVCGDRWFDKPADLDEARSHLKALRGRTHELISAVCVARQNEISWHHVDSTRLTMISFSDDFLERYLERSGPEVLESVGVYRLEGLGAQLFSNIDGDYFTILGLPLMPLLAFLREARVVDT